MHLLADHKACRIRTIRAIGLADIRGKRSEKRLGGPKAYDISTGMIKSICAHGTMCETIEDHVYQSCDKC